MTDRIVRRAPFLLAAAIVLVSTAFYRPQSYGIWADQMTYYLQANSIAYDGDLQFDRRDLERFRRHGWTEGAPHAAPTPAKGPYGLFLREAGGRFYYSKPFLYSLAAVPFVWVAPVRGLIVLNGLLWLALLEITFRWYRRFNPSGRAATIAALAWTASAAPFYIFVIHTDLMIPTLLAMALYLWLTSEKEEVRDEKSEARSERLKSEIQNRKSKIELAARRSIPRIVLAGVFFGLALYEKNPLFFFFAAALGYMLWRREWREAYVLLAATTAVFALPTSVHIAQDGHFSPYQGRRVYCDGAFPFDDLGKARSHLAGYRHPGDEFFEIQIGRTLLTRENLGRFVTQMPAKCGYYLVGRKTGLFPYLTPALMALALWFALRQWRGQGRATIWIAPALLAYVLFYFLTLSAYYGGPAAIGNRYALQVFPAFLLLVRRFPPARMRFASVVIVLAGAGLFFPGHDLLTPYGKMRDNLELSQKPRFRWLPFEWHLAWFMSGKSSAVVSLGKLGQCLHMTDLNPTYSENGYFIPSSRHQVALLTRIPLREFPVPLTAHGQSLSGWVRSGRDRFVFSLAPYETQLVRLPLALRRHAVHRTMEIYCYSIEIVTTSPLERNAIYPKDYYERIGPFVRWFADEWSTSATASLSPDDPRDSGRLLWGWHAPELLDERGMRRRWAGEATESAVVLAAAQKGDHILRVTAECAVAMETDLFWNGRQRGKWLIGPGKGVFSQPIEGANVRLGRNILCLRHRWLWQPTAINQPGATNDDRWLAVHYERFELEPAKASAP